MGRWEKGELFTARGATSAIFSHAPEKGLNMVIVAASADDKGRSEWSFWRKICLRR
jgi:hypothetical protein